MVYKILIPIFKVLTKKKTALIFWTNAPVIRKQTGTKDLKFHTRALGQQPWVLTC